MTPTPPPARPSVTPTPFENFKQRATAAGLNTKQIAPGGYFMDGKTQDAWEGWKLCMDAREEDEDSQVTLLADQAAGCTLSTEVRALIANLAAVVRVQNGNLHADTNSLLDHADRVLNGQAGGGGEAVAWQGRVFYVEDDEWGRWREIERPDLPGWQRDAERLPERYQVRPLYAAPLRPQIDTAVPVRMLTGDDINTACHEYAALGHDFSYSEVIQRKCAEVWGLRLAAGGEMVKPAHLPNCSYGDLPGQPCDCPKGST